MTCIITENLGNVEKLKEENKNQPLFYHPNKTIKLLTFGIYPSSLFILWIYTNTLWGHLGGGKYIIDVFFL